MKIGYCRVSIDDQNPDLQLAALQQAGCKRICTDKASGAHVKRPELAKCLKALNAGDVLVVWKLDRLGRSLRDLIALLDDLQAGDVGFRSLTTQLLFVLVILGVVIVVLQAVSLMRRRKAAPPEKEMPPREMPPPPTSE